MLSLESIEKRLLHPKAYYVFYIIFYRAAIGEARWKECMDDNNDTARIGNDSTEAFALLMFANNYKAWLYEMKLEHGTDLCTEYDTLPGGSGGKVSIADVMNPDLEFGETCFSDSDGFVLEDPTDSRFKGAAKKRMDWAKALKKQPICVEMDKTWKDAKENATPAPTDKRERENKKRKVMKSMKRFTGVPDSGERKFKGWSDSGHKAFQKTTLEIKADATKGMYAVWDKAFRQVSHQRHQSEFANKKSAVEKYAVDTNVVWEL
jgi:hypothetical protein